VEDALFAALPEAPTVDQAALPVYLQASSRASGSDKDLQGVVAQRRLQWDARHDKLGSTQTALGYHGYIGLLVFMRRQDILDGVAGWATTSQEQSASADGTLATGKNIAGHRTANKGAVGIGCRYFDTTLAFVTAHLSSDAKDGTGRAARRNTDASEIMRLMKIGPEDSEVCEY
jgi:hypothetical protein